MTVPTPVDRARPAVRALRALGLAAVLVLPVAACTSTVDGSATAAAGAAAPSTGSDPTTTTTAPEETTTDSPPPGGGSDGPAAFGDTFTYDNGLAITVGPAAPFTPSEYAVVEGAAAHLAFDVTVRNGTGQNFDEYLLTTLQSGNAEAEQVFDIEAGISGPPSTTLLDGREQTFKVGFGVSDPADLVLEVTPGFDYEPVIFATAP